MPIQTDLVIQISNSGAAADMLVAEKANEGHFIAEVRRCLQPGVEIALVFRGYIAITSILWLAEPLADHGLRAGVRLLGVSALHPGHPASTSHDESRQRTAALQLDSQTMP